MRQGPKGDSIPRSEFREVVFTDQEIHIVPIGETVDLINRYQCDTMAPNKPIFLLDQMDAVEARDKNWPRPPFELNQDDKSDYGQGSIDNKLSITRLSPTLICFKKEGFVPY